MGNEIYTNSKINVEKIKDFSRWEDGIKDSMIDFIFIRDTKSNEVLLRTKSEFTREFKLIDLPLISAKDFQAHVSSVGRSNAIRPPIEERFTEASKSNGMILVIKSFNLPPEAMIKEVDLKGQVIIASVISEQAEEVEEYLTKLHLEDENLNDVVELAVAHLSNKKVDFTHHKVIMGKTKDGMSEMTKLNH